LVLPNTLAHLDGNAILTYTFSSFWDNGLNELNQSRSKKSSLHPEKIKSLSYTGFIALEKYGHI
jgi:hypothetical protein